ncbi:UNVERIFIED_CONTAM: hypothetical protein PYX00_000990 [Menopon gallinae]|uniref:Resistance to inhibitors of cholinesterase protein 3 N-terminal domain-containing protein n=1 Tax=Menopon gallinae TaxID=328185 RepID=A0AAW2ID56_9NEOP
MANVEFGTGKTVLILTIVAACFAVLWPKIFYPMLVSSPGGKPQSDNLNGCCDVIFEKDVNAIRIMSEMCGSIFKRHEELDPKLTRAFQEGQFSKKLVDLCRAEVKAVCGIDIAEFLSEKVRLGQSYRQILDEIRSYNISFCLRQNFGINPGLLGIPRRMITWRITEPRHLRQERPLHLRPEMMHPALRERGRAIPQSNLDSKVTIERDGSIRPPPVPGMRPPMGGPGHVVPPPKVGATMSIVMPLYTIGIVIFSMYTIMKVFIRKTGNSDNYKDFNSDPEFRRMVFAEEYSNGCAGSAKEDAFGPRAKRESPPTLWKAPSDEGTRLGWKERDTIMTAITGLLAEVDQQLSREGDTQTQYSTDLKEEKKTAEDICTEEVRPSGKADISKAEQVDKREITSLQYVNDALRESAGGETAADDSRPKVKVMGVETMAECEGGQKWSRPASPSLGVGGQSRGTGGLLQEDPEPQDIFLEGSLPTQSQLLVTDSKTQTLTLSAEDDREPPVILSGKVTLSLISLDTVLPEDTSPRAHPAVSEEVPGSQQERETAAADSDGENQCEHLNEKLEEENYTTATMSDGAHAAFMPETEDTGADLSNIDALDTAEDQEEFQEDDQVWNGAESPSSDEQNVQKDDD